MNQTNFDQKKQKCDFSSSQLMSFDEEKAKSITKKLLTEIAVENKRNGDSYDLDLGKLYLDIKALVKNEIENPESTDYSIKKVIEKIDLKQYQKVSSNPIDSSNSSIKKQPEKSQNNFKTNSNKENAIEKQINKIELPIDKFKEEIVEKVKTNQTVIISAETGAGKSTRVA